MDSTQIVLNQNWKFYLGDEKEAYYKGYDDNLWEKVMLPHDWSVSKPFSREYSSGTGYLAGGIGWYRLRFRLPEAYQGKKIRICFDGVYKNSQVWCNSYYLGKRPNGYVPFSYDITEQAAFGSAENVISVKVTHTDLADSRWFTGSGITRNVSLLVEEPIHPVEYGIFFTTLHTDPHTAQIEINHELLNETKDKASITLKSLLVSNEGNTVLTLLTDADFAPHEQKVIALNACLEHPLLWSPDTPALYDLITQIGVDGGEFYTVHRQKVGIRSIRFDPDKGCFLNEIPILLKGVCLHHDGGCLGAAMVSEVWIRRLCKLKEMGCNAIRTSHNPHMPELYDLCDALGFVMIDEAFDEWENPKNKWSVGHNVYPPKHDGYYEDFPQWHKEDLLTMVKRDRNHPSVIMWSIGNEVDYPNDPYCHPLFSSMTGNNDAHKPEAERMFQADKPNAERLTVIATKLASLVRTADTTRPVSLAAAFPELTSLIGLFDCLDVVGYNYKEHLYETDHLRFPDKPFIGSENSHSYQAWCAVTDHDYISGQFLWTGIDYLGEAHGWPIHGSQAGLLTLAGFEKPSFYRRKALWCDAPFVHLVTARDHGISEEFMPVWEGYEYLEREPVLVRAYTNQPLVELFINGTSLGTQSVFNEFHVMEWSIPFTPGLLSASAYNEKDQVTATHSIQTALAPCCIKLSAWDNPFPALTPLAAVIQVEACITDCHETLATNAAALLEACVSGSGVLMGLENGDLADHTEYAAPYRRTLNGRLMIYIRRTSAGPITLEVTSKDWLRSANMTIE